MSVFTDAWRINTQYNNDGSNSQIGMADLMTGNHPIVFILAVVAMMFGILLPIVIYEKCCQIRIYPEEPNVDHVDAPTLERLVDLEAATRSNMVVDLEKDNGTLLAVEML
ncbi:unnamed protein product [Orchesella dallaii]|uniref:Uncharacterized protein n=1 Tax=Orchesella dallaii TaxID=48710 RepID=A0ABP1R5U0_9HEXA